MGDKFINYSDYACGGKHSDIVSKEHQSKVYVLPSIGFVEVEAFKMNSGIEKLDLNNIAGLPNFNFDKGPISFVLRQCKDLSAEYKVMIKINGPLTIISELIGLNKLFLFWKKSPDEFYKVLKRIENNLSPYINECINYGASIISYGDAICSRDILGPRYLHDITTNFSYPFLKRIETVIDKRTLLHLCPKISGALKHLGLASTEAIKLTKKMSYEDACLYIDGLEAIVGSKCIEYREIQVEKIEILKLK